MKTSALLLLITASVSQAWPIYQLHEWGTFTTVSGSDGTLLSGLEREEETLPQFIHAHFGLDNSPMPNISEALRILQTHGTLGIPSSFKGLGKRPLLGVTVKMETPVIYFHSNEISPIHANIKVGFKGGTISQWFPERSGGETLPEPKPPADPAKSPTPLSAWLLDFNKPWNGAIEWDLDILPPKESRDLVLFKPGDSLGWLRARQPMTNAVRTSNGETEGYLFYRGVGNFDPGLKTTIDAGETLHLENKTGGAIPYLMVFEMINGELRWTERQGGLDAGASMAIAESDLKAEQNGFSEPLYRAVSTGLAKCGLTDSEARAMVETWWKSYFEASGLRVFWVVPRETTDRVLPLDVNPPPTEIVRVLVGRSEVLRPRQEKEWLAASREPTEEQLKQALSTSPVTPVSAPPKSQKRAQLDYFIQSDRFGLAIQERLKTLGAPDFKTCRSMKPASTPSKAGLLIAVLFFLSYLAGYGVIRKDCTPFSPPYYVVPSYLTSSPTLRMIYRPCFLLESRLLENQFIISPWGIMAP